MKRTLASIFFFVTLFLLSQNVSFACSINEFVPLKFNPNEYVFFGKVIGYTGKVESTVESGNRKIPFTGYGLKIKVDKAVNLPTDTKIVEVFSTYPKDTACTKGGVPLDNLKKGFPIDTKVRVIGQENSSLLGTGNDIPKIEVSFANQGHLFNNLTKKGKVLSTSDSIFDYRLSLPLYGTKFSIDETSVWLFEIRKDLKRLEDATSPNEKFEILRRLAFAYDNYQDYGQLVEKQIMGKDKIKDLLQLKKNWEKKKSSFSK